MGGMLGNKRQDRGKKFRGPEIWGGGNFWGKCKKRVEKLFGGSVGGAVNPKQIYGGNFLEKCQRKKCDAVGMVPNEKKGKIFPKKI